MVATDLKKQNQSAISNLERQRLIDWLRENNFPVLPVAPAQDAFKFHKIVKAIPEQGLCEYCPLTKNLQPIPLYTGKNPSYLDRDGKPYLLNHRQFQNRLPSEYELKEWFANPANGVGTLGGWNNTIWLDFDVKNFASLEECDRAAQTIMSKPELKTTFVGRTHSKGWRVGVRVKQEPNFTNFTLRAKSSHIGEALGAGRFTVLYGVGPSGNAYQIINLTMPAEVESLEAIGVYSTKKYQQDQQVERLNPPPLPLLPSTIPLEVLGNEASRAVLRGDYPTGDRSEALATAIQEWYGWENWASTNSISISGDTKALAHYVGTQLGIDSDRVDRILKTINSGECHPAALYKGSEHSCWKKIYRLDKATFEVKCPSFIREAITCEWKSHHFGGKGFGGSGGDGDDGSGFGSDDQHQNNEWNAPISWNGEIGWLITEKRIKTETDPVTGEINPVLGDDGKPFKEEISKFIPRCDFDFYIERELASKDGGGLVLQIKRSVDEPSKQERVIVKSIDYSEVTRFVDALKTSLGSGIVCNLKKEHLGALFHTRLKDYRDRGGKIYRLAERVGQQEDGTWVFESIQFTSDGNLTTEEESGWVFNPNLGGEDKVPSPQIVAPDPKALKRLVSAMLKFHGSTGIYPAVIVLGFVAAGIHYQKIMRREGRFPLMNQYGDGGSNKSIAAQNALSLVGWATLGVLHRVTVSAIYEWLKLSGSLPTCLDDPERNRDLDELLKGLYDGRPRKVRGNYQEPHSHCS